MDSSFTIHNSHLEDANKFSLLDPHLRNLKHQIYVYSSPLLKQFPTKIPGIYTLSGGRQIGKTTLLKQWMLQLLKEGVSPQAIFFYTGEVIDDHHMLLRLLQNQLQNIPKNKLGFLIIDEITYVKEWDKGIKFAADAGMLENIILM